jgi:hypothetical protein
MLRSLDALSKISDESNQLLAGDEHLLRGIHAEAGVCGDYTDHNVWNYTCALCAYVFVLLSF